MRTRIGWKRELEGTRIGGNANWREREMYLELELAGQDKKPHLELRIGERELFARAGPGIMN